MAGTKSTLQKKPRVKTAEETRDEDESGDKHEPVSKKPVEIDISDDSVPLEEKEDESTGATDDVEDSTDDDSLDEDELNPFGDKWEQ